MDLENLHVAGDRSKLPTWANPTARSCAIATLRPWALYLQCWVYGLSFYELIAHSLQHRCQLPLVISMADCNRHDSVHGLETLYRGCETFGLPIQIASRDMAHDALGLFRLATQPWHTALVVRLNEHLATVLSAAMV